MYCLYRIASRRRGRPTFIVRLCPSHVRLFRRHRNIPFVPRNLLAFCSHSQAHRTFAAAGRNHVHVHEGIGTMPGLRERERGLRATNESQSELGADLTPASYPPSGEYMNDGPGKGHRLVRRTPRSALGCDNGSLVEIQIGLLEPGHCRCLAHKARRWIDPLPTV